MVRKLLVGASQQPRPPGRDDDYVRDAIQNVLHTGHRLANVLPMQAALVVFHSVQRRHGQKRDRIAKAVGR